ncbi:3-oxoacyl-ACP synthase III family protein [uncultured Williamsia sp.]|uniref:3-oxoacyl-ACP synthase III family protein n=1 Tax=uncultured Williamsia sp. TaxID=259311 RepID=UPI0026023A0B|nr:ketoacyl-ACP synthase III [uncultured Williamsia sp.]
MLNHQLCGPAGVTEDWILEKTGIVSRRRVAKDEATSDVAYAAATKALADAGVSASQLSQVVVSTSTPDILGFAVASQVATALDCPLDTGTYDVNAACSGFLTAMAITHRGMRDSDEFALVIGTDVYSRFRNDRDKRSTALWGDGAGAVVIGPRSTATSKAEILATWYTRYPTELETGGIPAGGSRTPASSQTVENAQHFVALNGRRIGEIFKQNVPTLLDRFLDRAGYHRDQIDHVIPHQGNHRLVQSMADMLKVDPAKVHATADRFGNTGSATIPTTLDIARSEDRLREGDVILMLAIGIGMTFSFSLIRWMG